MTIKIIPTQFTKRNQYGDFKWMIQQEEYKKALFIYNDDIESVMSYKNSKGNACIREYNSNNPNIELPKSAGIPTGSRKKQEGFQVLDTKTKEYIDMALEKIKELIQKYTYDTLYYSANSEGLIGSKIFKPCDEVIVYITNKIRELDI